MHALGTEPETPAPGLSKAPATRDSRGSSCRAWRALWSLRTAMRRAWRLDRWPLSQRRNRQVRPSLRNELHRHHKHCRQSGRRSIGGGLPTRRGNQTRTASILCLEYLGDGAGASPPNQRIPIVTHPGRAGPPWPAPPSHLPVAGRSTPEILTGVRNSSRPSAPGRRLSEREGGVSGPRSGRRRRLRRSAPRPRSRRRRGWQRSDFPGCWRGARGPGQALNGLTPLRTWMTWRGPTCVSVQGEKGGLAQQAHALAPQRTSLRAAHRPSAPRTATLMVLTLAPVMAPKPPVTLPPPPVRLTRRAVRTQTTPTPAAPAPTLLILP